MSKDISVDEEELQEEKGMTFWDHLEDLRWTLFRVMGALLVFLILSFILMPYLFENFILAPTNSDFFLYRWFCKVSGDSFLLPNFCNDDFHVDIININIASQFLTHITTSFWLAFLLTFPYLIFEIWKFIRPALYDHEKRSMSGAFFFGAFMFFVGCFVGYTVVFPLTFRFLAEYQLSETITNQISLNSYMGNFLMMIFIMGVVFEMPLLAMVLSKLGLVNKAFFKKYRKYAVVILLALAAVITPSGDPFTLMVVFLPLYLLYEVSIFFVKDEKKELEDEKE